MSLLQEHVPLALLCDLAEPEGPARAEILEAEGGPRTAGGSRSSPDARLRLRGSDRVELCPRVIPSTVRPASTSRGSAGAPVRLSSPQGRFAEGAALLDGRVLERTDAYGKHLFLGFAGELWLHVHLGLYGVWTFGADPGAASARRAAGAAGERRRRTPTCAARPPARSTRPLTGGP